MHRPWRRAAWWLLILGPFFFMSYGAATLLAARHEQVGSIVYDWEHHVPFLPWTIVPYWSIDILYGISLFVCANEHELTVHVRRLFAAQVVCVACFIVFPLTFTFHRPPVAGLPGFLFGSLEQFDRPFNQAPSLHIALLVILWVRYAAHVARSWRWLLHVWFALIGVSVLTTWQHHFVDVPTGALVGFLCLWLWPDELESPLADIRRTEDPMRRRLAAFYGAGAVVCGALAFAFGGATLWLLWPAVSLTLVAAAYLLLGPAAFQKGPDGAMSLAARWLLAPYIAAAWLNSRLWTRRDAASAPVGDGVFIGEPGRGMLRLQQPLEFDVIEADQVEVVVGFAQRLEFGTQSRLVPPGVEGQLVVGDDERATLRFGQVAQQDYRHLLHSELLRCQFSRVARNDVVVGADQNRVRPPVLADRRADLSDLLAAVGARVVRAGNQAFDRPEFDVDVDFDRRAGLGGFRHSTLNSNRGSQSSTVELNQATQTGVDSKR